MSIRTRVNMISCCESEWILNLEYYLFVHGGGGFHGFLHRFIKFGCLEYLYRQMSSITMIQGNCERTVNLPGLSYITDKIDKGPSMEVALCLFLLLSPSWAAVLQKRASQSELDMLNTIACIVPLVLVIVSKAYITRNLFISNFTYLCIYLFCNLSHSRVLNIFPF